MPFFRDGDKRLKEVANKVDAINKKFVLDFERYNADTVRTVRSFVTGNHTQSLIECYLFQALRDVIFWISGVNVPPAQCGVLSSRTGIIGYYNCEDPLPFLCEKGTVQIFAPLQYTYYIF